jgi:transposase
MENVSNGAAAGHDVQVSAISQRRRFPAAYKLKIVREADECSKAGDLGALLITAPKRGRKPKPVDPNAKRVADLERQLAKATARAEHAEALVELQKKVAALLGRPFPSEKS